ncbi:MAG: hypothetical protein QM692_12625 [Thermomicrobiales bacterium]
MARLQARNLISGIIVAVLLAAMPLLGRAQSSATSFSEALAAQAEATVLAGPNAADLTQAEGVLTVYKSGLDIADFMAHAVFTNPEVVDGIGWDYGFQFHTTGNNNDLRIFVTSDGVWNYSIGTETPQQSAVAPGLVTDPGAANALDIVVNDGVALFGVNGQFAGTAQLPEEPSTGDVFASTGFLNELALDGRVVALSDFTVYALPGSEAPALDAENLAVDGPLPARPVTLVTGSCAEPGATTADLLEATYPVGERTGAANAVVAETSFTRAPILLSELMASPHAIVVGESLDAPDTAIACAEVGGIPDEVGGFVIGLSPQNGAPYAGSIFMAADDAAGATNISVFLVPVDTIAADAPADAETADAEAGDVAPAATPAVAEDVEQAAIDESVDVIEVEDAAATPAA